MWIMDQILGKPTCKGKVEAKKGKWKKQKGMSQMIKKIGKEWCHDKEVLRRKVRSRIQNQQNVHQLVNG